MPLIATASTQVRNKNIILILLCAVFAALFVYDGFYGYVQSNDNVIRDIAAQDRKKPYLEESTRVLFAQWPGWANATDIQKEFATSFVTEKKLPVKWHNTLDLFVQKILAVALVAITGLAVWWFLHCQKRRAIADEKSLSPAPGVEIPWDAITEVDNTRWKKSGIVTLTYKNVQGLPETEILDEYHLDNLRPLLQELERRAVHAKFISPGQPEETAPAGDNAEDPKTP